MKMIAINGSPRRNKNTATLLQSALDGAKMQGAETELINLYDLNYKGCISCFACKLKNGKNRGKCSYQDDLTPVLDKILSADALLLGSPIYFESVTGEMRSFLERLLFPILEYTEGYPSILKKKIPTGFIYTMNVTKEYMESANYIQALQFMENDLSRLLGDCESMTANDTLQFPDYSKYVVTVFDEDHKKQVHETQFPNDRQKAYNLGANLIEKARQ